jgi:hypothetical protein
VSSNLRRHRKVHRSEYHGGYESGQHSASSIATNSASGSAHSFQSCHGRNSLHSFFNRRSNTSHGDSPGDKDFCTAPYTSEVSPSSGRRGPLGEAGRAALRAVKAVGACWRCKVLRKKVCFLLQTASNTNHNRNSAILRTLAKGAQRRRDHFGKTSGADAERFYPKRNTFGCAHGLFRAVCCPVQTFRISLP